MPVRDGFQQLARHYDAIMAHVNYERWSVIAGMLAGLLSPPICHVDAACGTGLLLARLKRDGWRAFGLDLSPAMAHQARCRPERLPVAVADVRALPVDNRADLVTCLFDSVNFLLDDADLSRALGEFGRALRQGGLLYFDVVTERMVLEHFAGKTWTEQNGAVSTTWTCDYDPGQAVARTRIKLDGRPSSTILERIYTRAAIEDALRQAGLDVLGIVDAESWRTPGRRTLRLDVVAVKGDARALAPAFAGVRGAACQLLRGRLRDHD